MMVKYHKNGNVTVKEEPPDEGKSWRDYCQESRKNRDDYEESRDYCRVSQESVRTDRRDFR